MHYSNIEKGIFLSRPNRFLAHVVVDGKEVVCHVKNTGRCKELLIPNCEVYVQHHDNPNRKTEYSLISVQKGNRLVNIDSQAPNIAVKEWLEHNQIIQQIRKIYPEKKYCNSRFDFYLEREERPAYVEVKGVTLEENGVVLFPDAPTERGIKHIYELCQCKKDGFDAYIIFVIQMQNVRYFTPNIKTHPAFGEALQHAKERGVNILAFDCKVTPDSMSISSRIPVHLL
ncbi:MAG: DNA/RNA nuclease SfsA [Clostridium sp.]|nr:DNA/RNA nuclease SfsA [Clostridium sp.]